MTWLFIPSNYVPASECSEKEQGPHSSITASDIEPFVTWSAKPVPPANLSRLWKKERSIRRLSGLTYSHSMAQRGADAWIASLPDSLVRTCPLPAAALGLMASAPDSSSTSSTLPKLAVRGSSFWRTSQESYLQPPPLWTKKMASSSSAQLPASWENWPIAGGMRNGSIYVRTTWAEVINANGGSASHGGTWLTPNVPNGGRSVPADVVARRGMTESGKRTVDLGSEVRHWATPDANAMERTNRSDSPNAVIRPTLALAAAQWATPTARDHKDGSTSLENVEVNGLLGRQVLLSTKQADSTSSRRVLSINDGRELSPTDRTLRPRLNPAFACWLMGWPIWWTNPGITNSVRSEMASYRSRLQQHLSSFFGAQDCAQADTNRNPNHEQKWI